MQPKDERPRQTRQSKFDRALTFSARRSQDGLDPTVVSPAAIWITLYITSIGDPLLGPLSHRYFDPGMSYCFTDGAFCKESLTPENQAISAEFRRFDSKWRLMTRLLGYPLRVAAFPHTFRKLFEPSLCPARPLNPLRDRLHRLPVLVPKLRKLGLKRAGRALGLRTLDPLRSSSSPAFVKAARADSRSASTRDSSASSRAISWSFSARSCSCSARSRWNA